MRVVKKIKDWRQSEIDQLQALLKIEDPHLTLAEIGGLLGLKASSVWNWLDHHGMGRMYAKHSGKRNIAKPVVVVELKTARRGSEPMPAGHEVSWGAITAGTMLQGTRYPLVVLDGRARAVNRTAQF